LLKPALEALALSRGSHRDASLQTAFDALSSYHIRNKRQDLIETSIAFTATSSLRLCSACNKSQCLSSAALIKVVHSIHKNWHIPERFQDDSGPGYCEQCLRYPPRCKCGKPRSAAWKLTCDVCWKQKKSATKKDQSVNNAGHEHRVNVAASSTAPSTSTTPSPQSLNQQAFLTLPTAPPYPPPYYQHSHPQSIGHHQQHPYRGWIAAPHQQVHQFQSPHGTGPHGTTRAANIDDDSLSDYSYASQSNYMFVAPHFDWQWFDSSSGQVHVHEAVQEQSQEQSNWGIFSGSTLDLMRDQHTYYVDSAASMHCTDNLLHLINVRTLKTPIRIKGISKDGWVFFTHVGDLPWLPVGMQQCFYSKDLGARLVSLNYMCLSKRTLYYNVPEHHSLVILVDGQHFVTCRQSSNNLLPLPRKGRGVLYNLPCIQPMGLSAVTHDTSPQSLISSPLSIRTLTKEQLHRCDMVEALLDAYCRPSDECLANSIKFGALGNLGTDLSPSDVHLNRLLRGPDIYRAQGRIRDPPAVASTTQPAPSPCWVLVIDQHQLKFPDIFGNTFKIYIVDEFTDAFWIVASKSGTAKNLQDAVMKFIHNICNANGHRVRTLHADADSVFSGLSSHFGSLAIRVQLAPPGHHAKRIERYTQTFHERKRMLEASLAFRLPESLGLEIFLDLHVASSMRALVNTVSYPNTPDEIILRERTNHRLSLVPFQAVVMVRMGESKRQAIASSMMINIQRVPMTELAVCLGRADISNRASYYVYVHSTRKVLIRRNLTRLGPIIPDFCIPNPNYNRIYRSPHNIPSVSFPPGPLQNTPMQHISPSMSTAVTLPTLPALDEGRLSNLDKLQPTHPEVDYNSHLIPSRSDVSELSPASEQNFLAPTSVTPPVISLVPDTTLPLIPLVPVSVIIPTPPVVAIESQIDDTLHTDVPQPTLSPHTQAIVSQPQTQRVSTRINKGQNKHLSFDNNYVPSQRARKAALIAQRARERNVFSEATWADILNPEGPYVVPPASLRAFAAAQPHPHSNIPRHRTPIHVSLRAGSRRSPPNSCAPMKPAFTLQMFRHIIFLALLQQSIGDLSGIHTPVMDNTDWNAFTASHLMATDLPASPSLKFLPKDNKEMTYRQGVRSMPPEELRIAVAAEMTKLFDTHKAIRPIESSDIRPGAVRIYSSMLVKTKYFADGSYDRISARLAAGGNTQPDGSYGETYAPTADESSGLCAFASFAAHAVQHNYADSLQYSNFVVKGAFLWVPRDNSTQIIMRLPSYIDHPFAGRDVEVLKSIYGLKDSNANFDVDF